MKKRFSLLSDISAAINDTFNSARQFGLTHDELLKRVKAIADELNTRTPAGSRRYSEYEAHYANGYIAARQDDIWQLYTEFCYRDSAGVLYSTHRESTHRKTEEFYAAGRGAELAKLEGSHVWKGTDKPFTPWNVV